MRSLLALIAVALTAGSAAAAGFVTVPMNQGVKISVPGVAKSVVIGNPAIADVNVLDSRTVLVVGRGYGTTNLVIVDARGATLVDRQIIVQASDVGRMTVYRGTRAGADYACSPRCELEDGQGASAANAANVP